MPIEIQAYLLPAAIVGFLAFRFFRFRRVRARLPALLKDGALIVDVRTPGEFAAGHSNHSVNIPLDTLKSQITQWDPNKTVIVCCASGSRSAVAAAILKREGFQSVINAGPWKNTVFN